MTSFIWILAILTFIIVMALALLFCKMAHDAEIYDEQFRKEWEAEHETKAD